MRINYNVTGKERKALVTAITQITGADAKYLGVPSCNYEVDYFTIDRNGTLIFDDRADSSEIELLIERLAEQGFESEVSDPEETQEESTSLTIAIPLDKVAAGNLTAILDAKGDLIKKALGISETPIIIDEEKISFPWFFEELDADSVKAYTNFIAAICKMSREQKRISSTKKEVENEKYAFRCFLLRLGFLGAEYKTDRKILLKNLDGSSAFKSGKKEVADHEISE